MLKPFSFMDLCNIYLLNLQDRVNNEILKPFRDLGSRPIVIVIVDDLHHFLNIPADSSNNSNNTDDQFTVPCDRNGLYYLSLYSF